MNTVCVPPRTYSPILIGGLHRSGTNLVRRVLHSHPNIAVGPESNIFRKGRLEEMHAWLRDTWAPGLDPRYEFDPERVDQVMATLMSSVMMPYCEKRGKKRWAEKTPKNILFIDTL